MKLVVVGASGNVGTALLRALSTDGGHHVIGVARRIPLSSPPYDNATWTSLDIADPASVTPLTEIAHGADAVINLAWGFQPARDVSYLEAVGLGGLDTVLSAVVAAEVPQVVQMSSVGAYSAGSYGVPVSESFPTDGIPTSAYSRHKAAAERRLDRFEVEHPQVVVTRPRPGLVMNGDAASSLLRYGVPGVVPARAVDWLPVLPLDAAFRVPVVHADDVAGALVAMVRRQAGGAFNLATPTPLDPVVLGRVLGAQPVSVPRAVLRAAVATAWWLHLERLDPGWIDLAFSVPLMDSGRASRVLDWNPGKDAEDAVSELVDGMIHHRRTVSPVLRQRSVRDEITKLRHGSITRRKLP